MASENNEISDIVKKCKILLLDIEGTTTSISFVKDKLFPYAESNVKAFLESQWDDGEVKEAVAALRKLAIEDQEKNVEGVVTIPGEDASKEEQIEGLVSSVQWQMSADRKVGPLKQLQGLIWKQGYDKGDIKGHVYDDVAPALELWRSTEGQKVYIYSSGSVQAQKLLFNNSVAGDLLPHIEGHFDTAVGTKQETASYAAIAEKVGCKPQEILFLTDIVKEAEAARASGLHAALVSREGNASLPTEATASYPVLHSFDQLTLSNKRKQDPQEEEVPAKVPKTDIEADVKSATEMEATEVTPQTTETVAATENMTATEVVSKDAEEPEKMEVEEEVPVVENTVAEQVAEEAPVRIETTIEDITNSNEAGDDPVCDTKSVISEESVEKTEKNETEMMETESTEDVVVVDTAVEPKNPEQEKIGEETAPVAEETPHSTVTIQDVTNNEESINEAEILDKQPIVEEPPAVEMDDLKNVGDVLEKECDEILSKVQNVTNLNNIPVKPLLNSIAEEPVESDNGENTNDIVESILDSEMELAVKPFENGNGKVPEITITKTNGTNEKLEAIPEEARVNGKESQEEKSAENSTDTNLIEEKAVKENIVEEKKDNEEKLKENSPTEKVTDEVDKVESTNLECPLSIEAANVNKQDTTLDIKEKTETTDTSVKPESDVMLDNKETEATVETVENGTASEANVVASSDDKMESEESPTGPVEDKVETKESTTETVKTVISIAELVENKSETVESIVEAVESNTETVESIAKPIESKAEIVESIVETVENKSESIASSAEAVDNKAEKIETIPEQVEQKMETKVVEDSEMETVETTAESVENKKVDNKAETKVNIAADTEMETVDTTAESVENKKVENQVEIKENITVDSEMETVETTVVPVENKNVDKTETKDNITVDSEMEISESPANLVEDKKEIEGSAVGNKTETEENIKEQVDNKMESEEISKLVDNKMESEDITSKPVEKKTESEESSKPVENRIESDESTPQANKNKTNVSEPYTAIPEIKVPENNTENKETTEAIAPEVTSDTKEKPTEDVEMETEVTVQVNGKTNGEPEANVNGDASKDEELSARLSVENGENSKEINGANGNGDSADVEKGQGDNKVESEVSEIKVKTVASEETRTDPIDHPVEA